MAPAKPVRPGNPEALPLTFRDSPQAMWVWDAETLRFLAVNDAALRLYGYTRAELGNKRLPDLLAPDDRRRLKGDLDSLPGPAHHVGVRRHLGKGGSVLEVDIVTSRVQLGGRRAQFSLLRDVTESRRVEEELKASEARYRALYSRTPVMMHSIDREGRIVSVSDLWLKTMGYKRDEVLGAKSIDFLTPLSRRYAREVVLPAFYKTGDCTDVPYQMVRKNGEIIDVLLSATAERDASGEIERSLAVSIDVTQLTSARAWFGSLVASSQDAINSVARDGKLLTVNPAFERLTGYTRGELLRMKFQDLTPPEYRALDEAAFKRLLAGEPSVEYEKEYQRKDGSRVPAHLTAFTVRGRGGRLLGYAAIIRDVTERRRLERELVESGAREQAKVGRELHDTVGQTVTAIALLAKSLRASLPASAVASRDQADKLARLSADAVKQVRGLARGLLPQELQSAELGDALRDLTEGVSEAFGFHCRLIVRGPSRLDEEAMAVQLYRIAQEALHNAAKHAKPKRVVVTLEVSAARVCLSVVDDGKGVPPAGQRGRGFGLGIMEHRARSLGGTLVVRRRRGHAHGTEVICTAPRTRR